MGVYDIYGDIQLKVGGSCLREYDIGDTVEIPDGVYLAPDGIVVIVNGIFVATFDYLKDKWGEYYYTKDIIESPFAPLLELGDKK